MCYYNSMIRKKRTDRNHIIYKICTTGNDFYIGVTAKTQTTEKKSLQVRFNKHVYRSRSEKKSWLLYEAMRELGTEQFTAEIIEVVRGKSPAHKRERELITELKPTLNTDTRGCF